jgi:hypothetical protein
MVQAKAMQARAVQARAVQSPMQARREVEVIELD